MTVPVCPAAVGELTIDAVEVKPVYSEVIVVNCAGI
jgi:hypothetical protein